jgi:hypothetical protein
MLSIVLPSFGIVPLHPQPFFIRAFDWTDISNRTNRGVERDALTYIIFKRHCMMLLGYLAAALVEEAEELGYSRTFLLSSPLAL